MGRLRYDDDKASGEDDLTPSFLNKWYFISFKCILLLRKILQLKEVLGDWLLVRYQSSRVEIGGMPSNYGGVKKSNFLELIQHVTK